jgi:hypothetical protein
MTVMSYTVTPHWMAWLPGQIHDWSVMDGTGHIGQDLRQSCLRARTRNDTGADLYLPDRMNVRLSRMKTGAIFIVTYCKL